MNELPTDRRGHSLLVATVLMLLLSSTMVAARIWTRRSITRQLGSDDYVMVAGQVGVCSLVMCGVECC